jgi:hypothetical protein
MATWVRPVKELKGSMVIFCLANSNDVKCIENLCQ